MSTGLIILYTVAVLELQGEPDDIAKEKCRLAMEKVHTDTCTCAIMHILASSCSHCVYNLLTCTCTHTHTHYTVLTA